MISPLTATTAKAPGPRALSSAGPEPARRHRPILAATLLTLILLALVSVCVGSADITVGGLLEGGAQGRDARVLIVSRIPRTAAAALSGAALAMAGALMQLLVRNRFVAPSTTGTVQFAAAGLLAATILTPGAAVGTKMAFGAVAAMAGSAFFLWLLRRLPTHRPDDVVVPLVGIMMAGVVEAATTFVAWRMDLMQSLGAWTSGDLSTIVAGRYELLWGVGLVALITWLAADRLTLAGLGRDHAVGLGLAYDRTMALGLAIVAITSAVTVVVVGALPFLGLVVPNIVSLIVGDNLRRSLPWVAVGGAAMVLACDVVGRLLIRPYEISAGVIMGIVGSLLFLILLLRRTR
ncbi:ABC transporter permease [Actinomyces slackii]|uniref:Iron-uptake system permease protein FeuB n=1 Tax=Actinomyces slackii TaxID=52774 RepID=A0A448KFM9_9ACTO|nr:iron chelate uptake ABC transporter family permease subunit [Actinomyces slackii]VEG75754.1 Iron-uptake system permease protein FeuB [Actinomyces slackii]